MLSMQEDNLAFILTHSKIKKQNKKLETPHHNKSQDADPQGKKGRLSVDFSHRLLKEVTKGLGKRDFSLGRAFQANKRKEVSRPL